MKPLTPRMIECLIAMDSLNAKDTAVTPNEIAYRAGFTEGGIRHRGPWSGYQAPSNRVNFALTGLEKRGLVRVTERRDDLSGTARMLTAAGAKVAHDLDPVGPFARMVGLDKRAGSRHSGVEKAKEAK